MIIGAQIRMARAALKWGIRDLATRARVSPTTINRMEQDMPATPSTLAAVQRALEEAGIEFHFGDKPGVRMRRAEADGWKVT